MKTKAKKLIYTLGAITMAVVVFLFSLFFTGNRTTSGTPGYENSSTSQSSSQLQNSSSGAGLGGGGGDSSGGGSGGPSILFTVLTDKTQTLYLRQDSKGDYTGKGEHGFVGDTKYYLENPTDANPLYYLGLTMQNSQKQSHQAQIELVELTNELLPYAPISKTGDINEDAYTVTYSPYNYFADGLFGLTPMGDQTAYTAQENAYYQFVLDTYLSVPTTLKQTLLALAEENNIYANSNTVIYDVVSYIQNAAYYDYYYADKNYPNDKDMVTYFLTEHKRGVCRHFAAAATMMFRALGIPARYTIGFAVNVEADVKLIYGDDLDEQGHAWTEIYLPKYGWVPLEVTGGRIYTGGTGA